jgi:hypothetical protein
MYLFIFENEKYAKTFIFELLKYKKLDLDNKKLDLPNINKKNIKYIIEIGRGIVPIDKDLRDHIYLYSEKAKRIIKEADFVFLIRENLKIQLV